MPAPAPIRIRYGPTGLLGQAIAESAAGERYSRQAELDSQFIGQMLDHANRMKEMKFGSELEANRLQAAYALQRAQNNGSPAAPASAQRGDYYAGAWGNGDASSTLKNSMLLNSPVSEESRVNLKTLVGRKDITPEQFRSVVFEAEKKNKADEAEAKTKQSREQKRKYLASAAKGMSEQDAASLGAMIEDDGVSLAQIRTAADAIRQRNTVLPRTKLALQAQGIDTEARTLKSRMDSIAKVLAKLGINPEVSKPAELNPTYLPTDAYEGPVDEVTDAYFKSADLVQEGNVDARDPYIAYHRIKQQYERLLQQREALLNGSTQSVSQMSDEQLLAALSR